MRILLVGAGGVGSARSRRSPPAATSSSRWWSPTTTRRGPSARPTQRSTTRFTAAQVDASDADAVAALCATHRITHVLNAVDPRFVMPIFDGAFAAGADYLDMAMSLSQPHPDASVRRDRREARRRAVRQGRRRGRRPGALPWSASASSRGCPTCSPATPPTTCSATIDELGIRDGANLDVDGLRLRPVLLHLDHDRGVPQPAGGLGGRRGWFTTAPFSEPEVFDFPEGIGPVECVNVEHEEVLLIPRWVEAAAGHVQVRARRRVHRRAQDAAQAWA